MREPKASHPFWPDVIKNTVDDATGLKSWSWALARLEKSHNYWIATTRPQGSPHLMLVWGVWWQDAFWFSTGPRTRKAKNIAVAPHCVIGTEDTAEAVILEGTAQEIKDRSIWKRFAEVYNHKYGGNVEPILDSCGGCVFRIEPELAFGQDEHAANFLEAVTRWKFQQT